MAEYGADCWELDALPPAALIQLVRDGIERYLDKTVYRASLAQESADKRVLLEVADSIES